MKKRLLRIIVSVLVPALALSLAGCQRKVTMKTGEIIICTAGEIIEDKTEEVEIPASEIEQYGVTMTVITCSTHGDVGKLYESAQEAIAAGDLAAAREMLATVVARDPAYGKAKEQLAAIDAGQPPSADTPAPTGDPGTAPADGGDTDPVGPVASLTTYVPDVISGYVAQGILADGASLSRQYLPTAGPADQLMIEVEQWVSAGAAESGQAAMVAAYPEAQTSRTIGGRTVKAGASGAFAIAVFTDGSITIAVELHSASGTAGASLIEAALAVAGGIVQ